jgi:hypothetical protein
VVLHIGLPKTGTSAIQHVLAAAAPQLAGVGVNVPRPSVDAVRGSVTPGNGASLFRAISAGITSEGMFDVADAWLRESIVAGQLTLVSSELLATLPPAGVRALVAAASGLAALDVVVFVRDIYEHAYAAWGQVTKEGYAGPLEDYCQHGYPVQSEQTQFVMRWAEEFPDLVVRHYDTDGRDVVAALFEAVGLERPSPLRQWPVPQVNRSLDLEELELIRTINEVGRDPQMTRRIADTLSSRNPARRSAVAIVPDVLRALHERYDRPVADLNRAFFDGAPVLSIEPRSTVLAEHSALPSDAARQVVRCLAETHFGEVPVTLGSIRSALTMLTKLDEWRWGDERFRSSPEIPAGFDPVGYLLANPDVLEAGVDPYEHYLSSGHAEERQWSRILP